MAEVTTERKLDDILALKEPFRTRAIQTWLAEGDVDMLDAKIVPASGKPFKFNDQGKLRTIPPAGKRVPRRKALTLLRDYGVTGKYHNRDQATGVRLNGIGALAPALREMYKDHSFNFIEDHLTHVTESESDAAKEAASANSQPTAQVPS